MTITKKTRSKTCNRINKKEKRLPSLFAHKKADLAVTLLVFMAIALAGGASLIFILSSGSIKDKIVDARFLDEIYLTEGKLDFYLQEIFDRAVEKTKNSENIKEDFIKNFIEELSKYKINDNYILTEFIQVEEQINGHEKSNNIKYDETSKIISVEFVNIIITYMGEPFDVSYSYNRKFEKQIKEAGSDSVSVEETTLPTPPVASADLTKKVKIPGVNTEYDGYYIYFDGERKEFFLIETLNGYTIMKEGSGDYYALIEKDKDWRIVTYPDKPLPEYLQGKKFSREGDVIYFRG